MQQLSNSLDGRGSILSCLRTAGRETGASRAARPNAACAASANAARSGKLESDAALDDDRGWIADRRIVFWRIGSWRHFPIKVTRTRLAFPQLIKKWRACRPRSPLRKQPSLPKRCSRRSPPSSPKRLPLHRRQRCLKQSAREIKPPLQHQG